MLTCSAEGQYRRYQKKLALAPATVFLDCRNWLDLAIEVVGNLPPHFFAADYYLLYPEILTAHW